MTRPTPATLARRLIPEDFLGADAPPARQVDALIYRLLLARAALAKRGAKAAAATALIARVMSALQAPAPEPLDLVEDVLWFADANPLLLPDGRTSPDQSRAARLLIAAGWLKMYAPTVHAADDVLRAAMWPARGETRRSRGALARALGWRGSDASLHVRLAQRKR